MHDRGLLPYTITNGSLIDPRRIAESFPSIGISLDTLDTAKVEGMDRLHCRRVLTNLERLLKVMPVERIQILTVDFGQPLQPFIAFLRERGLQYRWTVQRLQCKDDYMQRYPDLASTPSGRPTF